MKCEYSYRHFFLHMTDAKFHIDDVKFHMKIPVSKFERRPG